MKQIYFEVSVESYANDIRKLYILFRPNARPEEIRCEEFSVGIVNRVIKMDDPTSNDPVVVRIFRMKLRESMTVEELEKDLKSASPQNRALEMEAIRKASEVGITVRLYATFRNGFIQPFVDGDSLSFEKYDLQLAKKIAAKIAQLHRLDLRPLAGSTPTVCWLVGKADDQKKIQEERDILDRKMKESPFEYHKRLPGFHELCQEMEHIHEVLLEKDAYGPVVFCHNDLNLSNLLIERSPEREPVLLDFEWVSTSYLVDFRFTVANPIFFPFSPTKSSIHQGQHKLSNVRYFRSFVYGWQSFRLLYEVGSANRGVHQALAARLLRGSKQTGPEPNDRNRFRAVHRK